MHVHANLALVSFLFDLFMPKDDLYRQANESAFNFSFPS